MQDKLQELTDRLYNEGLSKGRKEGDDILVKARAEAEGIVEKAKAEAEEIIQKAQRDADEYRRKVENDLKMASAQTLQSVKSDIENLVIAKIADADIDGALASSEFIKEAIKAVASGFKAQEAADISMVLPEKMRSELEPFILGELGKLLQCNIQAEFSKKVSGGFTIGPADGSYFISLTDETFKELIGEYLRPATKKILFG